MRAVLLICSLFLPVQACAQDANPDRTLDAVWAETAEAKILERDYRDFLDLLPGLYDNQEQVYFENELDVDLSKRHNRGSFTVRLEDDGLLSISDSRMKFSTPVVVFRNSNEKELLGKITPNRKAINLTLGDDCNFTVTRSNAQFFGVGAGSCKGETLSLSSEALKFSSDIVSISAGNFRRARLFKCWVSPEKEDGSYGFYNDVVLHDQGGMAWLSGEDHPRIGIKMRNVVWPTGRNRPSLVLYAYRGEDEDTAVSYAWTAPQGDRLAINLRWMQASCTLGDADITPSMYLNSESGD